MGGAKRVQPERLGQKLRAIRHYFDCSLAEMAVKLSSEKWQINRTDISRYELSQREPPLLLLLKYSKLINIHVDVLIDDDENLPEEIITST